LNIRALGTIGATLAAALLLASPQGSAQNHIREATCPDDAHLAFHQCALDAGPKFDPPRTPAGHPDMQGYWRRRAAAHESLEAHPETPDDSGGPSAVVDPPDGIVPIQPWAEAKRAEHPPRYVHHNAICLLSGVPVSMYMTGLFQFHQTQDYFVIQSEEAHAWRVIPLDGRPHIGEDIRLWQGDSRGHWEGNTLVVETTNQNAIPWLDQRGRFMTEEGRVVERFTLIDANTLHWQATIEDPNVFTQPFTVAVAFRRNAVEGIEIWEEACFEDNTTSMEHFMNVGYEIFPGISAEEARALKAAWEAQETSR
jgi:hypothetical protein